MPCRMTGIRASEPLFQAAGPQTSLPGNKPGLVGLGAAVESLAWSQFSHRYARVTSTKATGSGSSPDHRCGLACPRFGGMASNGQLVEVEASYCCFDFALGRESHRPKMKMPGARRRLGIPPLHRR